VTEEGYLTMNDSNYERATFAAGCFWGVEEQFSAMRGVISTQVGYTGGRTANPTYEDVCRKNTGHAEAVEVIYDPEKISYQKLLTLFFSLHSPGSVICQGEGGRGQYRGAAFYHTPKQKEEIDAEIRRLEKDKKYGPKIYTQVVPTQTFWPAEERHQKYYKKHQRHVFRNGQN